jgi:hypothetical protein
MGKVAVETISTSKKGYASSVGCPRSTYLAFPFMATAKKI